MTTKRNWSFWDNNVQNKRDRFPHSACWTFSSNPQSRRIKKNWKFTCQSIYRWGTVLVFLRQQYTKQKIPVSSLGLLDVFRSSATSTGMIPPTPISRRMRANSRSLCSSLSLKILSKSSGRYSQKSVNFPQKSVNLVFSKVSQLGFLKNQSTRYS